MDRLETFFIDFPLLNVVPFIFQYGQIRNLIDDVDNENYDYIYIPVWIDQKLINLKAIY